MSTSSSNSLDETFNGCLLLMLGMLLFFIVIIAFGSANWPCRILMGLGIALFLFCPRPKNRQIPTITYLPQANAREPLVTLQPGQFATVPWPHTLQVHLPAGVRLQVMEATPDYVCVIASNKKH